ncbi:cyclic nucleotide-binding/CBS domain-containing protein [Desulfococcus sp.]|uniref:CBS domain-containing protein n=1 Tax=Desulfococcus sp. TaxID=2025834 RepID=UPI003593BB96
MAIIQTNTILSELTVRETMRRQVISLPREAGLSDCINRMIKFKVNALLITGEAMSPLGVVSKTDIMGAYYAGLPVDLPAGDIMISPPLFCRMEDTLEAALEQMRHHGVYRLYVQGEGRGAAGVIAYPDIVGILYQYCHECKYSRLRRADRAGVDPVLRFQVKDVMTASVRSHGENDSLLQVMEGLSEYRMGAVLITDQRGAASGVVSKTDLALAYRHGCDPEAPARTIMTAPVRSCGESEYLEAAIRKLIFSQVHRIFVFRDDPSGITGVLSLSDAARVRSGSCQACVSSRITVGAQV